jgi:hypothetical protein
MGGAWVYGPCRSKACCCIIMGSVLDFCGNCKLQSLHGSAIQWN